LPEDVIPSDAVVPDAAPAAVPGTPAPIDIPAEDVVLDSEKYNTPAQLGLATAEAVGRGIAGPAATAVERAAGVPAEDIKARQAAHPILSGATEAGTFGLSLLTGVGEAELISRAGLEATEAATGASRLAKIALRSSVETGLMQAGDEVNKMILGDPASASEVALAAGAGLVGGAALGSVSPLWKAAKEATVGRWLRTAGDALTEAQPTFSSQIAQKAGKGLFGIPEEAVESYLKDVKGVQNASDDIWKIADKLPEAVSDVAGEGKSLSEKARKALGEERVIPASDVLEKLQGLSGKTAEEVATKIQEDVQSRAASVSPIPGHDMLTEREVRDVMDQLKKDANWKAVLPTPEKSALRQTYGQLNDVLRTRNAEYAEEIGQSAKRLTLRDNLVSKLRLVKDYSSEHGFRATDTTVSRLKDMARGDKREVSDILKTMKDLGHADLATEVKNTLTKLAFQKDATRGSRLTVLGATTLGGLGHATGIPGAGTLGTAAGGWLGAAADKYGPQAFYKVLGALAEKMPEALGAGRLKAEHAALPIARAVLHDSPSASGAKAAIDYVHAVATGEARVTNAVRTAIEKGGVTTLNHLRATDRDKDKVRKAASAMNSDPEQFLNHAGDLARHMPESAAAVAASKTRVLTYLNSLEPRPASNLLPFDERTTDPVAERRYDQALELAASPLSILSHVKEGSLTPDHVQDMQAMYPQLAKVLREKVFAAIVDAKHAEEKPSYRVRQSLSLLTGEPMDSTFLPQNIVAAQVSFAEKRTQQQPQQPKPKHSTSKLGKLSELAATGGQAADARANAGFTG
jgi:hypothetical protein